MVKEAAGKRRAMFAFLRSDASLAMLTRATQGAAMGGGAIVVIWRTSPVDQGYYFAFISFAILLQLCDFGLSYASLQAASRLLAVGRTSELPMLAARALRINGVVTALAALVVAAVGWWIFDRTTGDRATGWRAAWFVFVACVAANHLTAPYLFLVEGGVSVTRAWRFRLLQECASGAALLGSLVAGAGLWALVAYYGVRGALAAAWIARAPIARRAGGVASLTLRRWRDDLWPFQWRVGLGSVGSFLVFQAFGPILFALRGPTEAGRFSLSLALMNAIVMVTTAWPVSQAAHFGVLVGRSQAGDLSRRWMQVLVPSTAFATVGAVVTGLAFAALHAAAPMVADRFADPLTTQLLIATAVAHHVVACIAVVVRAEGRDPLLVLALAGGAVTLSLMTFAALRGGLAWVAVAYLVSTAATVPAAALIYRRFAARQRSVRPAVVPSSVVR